MTIIPSSFFLQVANLDLVLVVVAVSAAVGVLVLLYFWWIGAVIFKRPMTGKESLIGKKGMARTDLTTTSDEGEVTIDGIFWKARLDEGGETRVLEGSAVVVVGVSALTLIVKPSQK